MIKKIFISVIAVFYIAVTSGVVMNIHYCMGKVSSVTFGHEADHQEKEPIGKCYMEKTESSCCGVDVKTVKLNDLHEVPTLSFELASISALMPIHETVLHQPEQGVSALPSTEYFSPPPGALNKVYLDINVFRI